MFWIADAAIEKLSLFLIATRFRATFAHGVELFAPNHDVDTRKSAQVRSLLVTTGISGSFYLVQETAFAKKSIQYMQQELLVPLVI